MATPSAQSASAALPIASPALQPASTDGQQIDYASKIAEVMRDQFGLKPKIAESDVQNSISSCV